MILGATLYRSSLDPAQSEILTRLQHRMADYYRNGAYHREWIKGINAGWQPGSHAVQIAMCGFIPAGALVLEAGCGDGAAASEIHRHTSRIRYVGVDLTPELWSASGDDIFIAGSATTLPFKPASFDVVLSMFVIEHLLFPAQFLDDAWALLRPGGKLLVVAPDFWRGAMASERIGFSYGAGTTKLRQGRIMDAILTAFDTRCRIPLLRWWHRRRVVRGQCAFPILTRPRCLELAGFTPDCDAVYPASPEEIVAWLKPKRGFQAHQVFYRDGNTFGLCITKQEAGA
jgi:SAM-dependent methyltransferase